jgi:DNA polymerase (family 10)
MEAVLQKAAERDIAVEINAHPRRLDLHDRYAARARELGVRIVIDSDAHHVQGLDVMRFGVDQGRRAGLEASNVLNCGSREEVEGWLGRDRG